MYGTSNIGMQVYGESNICMSIDGALIEHVHDLFHFDHVHVYIYISGGVWFLSVNSYKITERTLSSDGVGLLVSHSRHVCCVTQQTCLLCDTANIGCVTQQTCLLCRTVCCVTQQTCLLSHLDSLAPVDRPRWVNLGQHRGNGRVR